MVSGRHLLLVDVQKDFMDDGAVPVRGAYSLIPAINELMERRAEFGFDSILATKDWHPEDHISFAPTHGKPLGSVVQQPVSDGASLPVLLFNPHCIAATPGADFADGLAMQCIDRTFLKGTESGAESFSGLYDLGRVRSTGLSEHLSAQGARTLCVVGVATEYCVKATVEDALQDGFRVVVVHDGIAAVDDHAGRAALKDMATRGARVAHLRTPAPGMESVPLEQAIAVEG